MSLAHPRPRDPFAPGLLDRLPEPPRRVALVRASRLGDFICATPAWRALRVAMPEAEITMITLPMLSDLVRRSRHLDRFAPFPGFPGIAEQLYEPGRALSFFMDMRAEKFDLAVQMQGSGVYSNPFTALLGARVTAGFVRAGDPPGELDAALPIPESGHEIERLLALTTFLGAPPRGEQTEYPIWAQDHAEAQTLLQEAEPPLIGLHAGAHSATRLWPLDRFVQAGRALRQSNGGTIVLLGSAGERERAERVRRLVGGPCLNLAGRTGLGVLGAVLTRLAVLVTNDSGPAHIAYALRVPTVTIFGGEDPARYGPHQDGPFRALAYPIDCRPCGYAECPIGNKCLRGVTVAQVVEAAQELMAPGSGQAAKLSRQEAAA